MNKIHPYHKKHIIHHEEEQRFWYFPLAILIIAILAQAVIYYLMNLKDLENLKRKIREGSVSNKFKQADINPTPPDTPTLVPASLPDTLIPPTFGTIAFVSDGQIWTVKTNKDKLWKITVDNFNKFHINISHDQKKVAYAFYNKDENKVSRENAFSGRISGIAVMTLEDKRLEVLAPYDLTRNHYPVWSPDDRYVSVWVEEGKRAQVYEVGTGNLILDIKAEDKNNVSPIVFIGNGEKVSYIADGNLIMSKLDGSEKEVLADKADPLRIISESPNVPEPPIWSKSGRYVTFYKASDLHILDVINKTDVLIEKGASDGFPLFGQRYPKAYLVDYSSDESKLYLLDYAKNKDTVIFDLKTGIFEEIAAFSQSAMVSPDKNKIVGNNGNLEIYSIADKKTKTCKGNFNYIEILYEPRLTTWSPDSKAIITYRDYGRAGIDLLNVENCLVYHLIDDKKVDEAIWFP